MSPCATLWHEETMNLLEIRKKFVELTGRYDLVADYAGEDYSDAGADFFIRAASAFLDSRVDIDKSSMRYQKDILYEDFFLTFPKCRAIESVYASSSSNRIKLEKKDISWIRSNYGNMAIKAVGDVVFSANPSASDSITVNSDTYVFDTDITIGSDIPATIDNTVAVINSGTSTVKAYRLGTNTLRIKAADAGYSGNSIVLTVNSEGLSANGSGTLGGTIAGCDGQIISTGGPLYFVPMVIGLSGSQNTLTHNTFGQDFTYDAEGIMFGSHYVYDGILIMPPVSEIYTITIFGKFFSNSISSDDDSNFWSVAYPDILLTATMYKLETFYRNTEGARDMLAALNESLFGLEKDVIMQELADVDSMKRPNFNY